MSLLDKIREGTNRFVDNYARPLFVDLSVKEVIKNYKRNRDEAFLKASEEAGVFDSLYKLEEGTQLDKIFNEMRFNIMNAEFKKKLDENYSRAKYKGITVELGDKELTSLERDGKFLEYDKYKLVIALSPEDFAYFNQSGEKLVPLSFIGKLFSESYKK